MNHRTCFGFVALALVAVLLGVNDVDPPGATAPVDYGALG